MSGLFEQLRAKFDKTEKLPFSTPDASSLRKNEIPIGHALNDDSEPVCSVGLPLEVLPEHVLVTGTTGTGKTWFIVRLIANLIARGVTVWILDTQGEFARYLLCLFGSDMIEVFDANTFKRNPLESDDRIETTARIKAILRELYLRDGSLNLLGEILKSLYAESNEPPTFLDVYQALDDKRFPSVSRRAAYKESLMNRIGGLIDYIPAYRCRRGFPLKDLTRKICIFDLSGMASDQRAFFEKELIASTADCLTTEQSGEINLAIVIDELHTLDSREMSNRNDVGEPIIRSLSRIMRRRGISLILADQVPSAVPNQLLALTNTKISFRLVNGPCQLTLAQSMSLSEEQQSFFPKLSPRQAVVYSRAFVGVDPFLLEVPTMNLERVSETEVDTAKQISASRFTWRAIQENSEAPNKAVIARNEASNVAHKREAPDDNKEIDEPTGFNGLSKQEFDYLESIALKAFTPATDRDKELGISLSVGSTRRKKLSDIGLIKSHRLQIVSHGGMTTLIEITDKGWDLLKKYKSKVSQPPGRGSFIHKFWQDKVGAHVRESLQGAAVSIEDGDGKAVDVLVRNGNETIGIEISISTRPEDELRNLINDFNFCDRVIVLAETETHLAEIMKLAESELGEADREKITTAVLSAFINSPLTQGATLT